MKARRLDSPSESLADSLRRKWGKTAAAVLIVSGLATFLTFPSTVEQALRWAREFPQKIDRWWNAVELPGTYPGEVWKSAKSHEFEWLVGDWCYPSMPDFRSRFRVVGGTLQRQNEGRRPEPFRTEWSNAKTYVSNRGVLRMRYDDPNLPGSFVTMTPGKTAEWHEHERYGNDDGTTRSGKPRLVLSCARCQVSNDGITYTCQ
jgi:hypothetical protein